MVNVPLVMGIVAVTMAFVGLGFAIAERNASRKAKAEQQRMLEEAKLTLEHLTISKTSIDPSYREISHGDTRHLAGMRQ